MPGEAVVFLSALAIAGFTLLTFPLVRALAERIRPRADAAVKDELQVLRDDVMSELRDMRREMAELGERVDFAERLLAKQGEARRIGDGR